MQVKKKDLNPTKPKHLKVLWAKEQRQNVWCVRDEKIYVGKMEFIKEHQPVNKEVEKIVEHFQHKAKQAVVSFGGE